MKGENLISKQFLNPLYICIEDIIGIPNVVDKNHASFIRILYEEYHLGNIDLNSRGITKNNINLSNNEFEIGNFDRMIYYNINEMIYISEKFTKKEIYLMIKDNDENLRLNIENILDICNKKGLNNNNQLIVYYLVYKYFMEKKYIVKDGFKYGVDYILYKKNPSIIHGEYCILICNFNQEYNEYENIIYNDLKYVVSIPRIDWKKIISLTRLCESVSKKLILTNYNFKKEMIENIEISRFFK